MHLIKEHKVIILLFNIHPFPNSTSSKQIFCNMTPFNVLILQVIMPRIDTTNSGLSMGSDLQNVSLYCG